VPKPTLSIGNRGKRNYDPKAGIDGGGRAGYAATHAHTHHGDAVRHD
jgi:hypothetical protein